MSALFLHHKVLDLVRLAKIFGQDLGMRILPSPLSPPHNTHTFRLSWVDGDNPILIAGADKLWSKIECCTVVGIHLAFGCQTS